jgi:holliday junction DNA helicase RuvA
MISTIKGKVTGVGEDSLVVEIGGLGFRVFVPAAVHDQAHFSDEVFLYTYLVVREDLLALYGFEKEEERDFFLLLLGVSGIGPRTSLAILSTLSVDAIRRAVVNEQAEVFARVSGVGKKTGQKILINLQGKVGKEAPFGSIPVLDVGTEVIDALTSLGYSIVEAQAALQSIPKSAPQDVESRLRLALQFFAG